jgi:tRNA threonylcarbamoyladenosine biosynthesis protein TsaB
MLSLILRTDKPEAELGLSQDSKRLGYTTWPAHRQLAETIHLEITKLLESQNNKLGNIKGLVVFKGPGSFTGLRIGLSVANALAYGLRIPIVSRGNEGQGETKEGPGEDWIAAGVAALEAGEDETVSLPEYGALPHITLPKH